ncbi:YlmH family RNA-binding protein [Clostridium sp. DL1XJH146]
MIKINKNQFLSYFQIDQELLASKLYEKIILANKTNKIVYYNEFLTPNIWEVLKEKNQLLGCEIIVEGFFEESERRFLAIKPFNTIDELNFPIKLIVISNSSKFSKINHRDYLGALTSLGVKRGLFGDLVINDEQCYLPVADIIVEFVKINLNKVKNSPVKIAEVNIEKEGIPTHEFEIIRLQIASERCDTVVSAAVNISRNEAIKLIQKGNVLVNYKNVNKKNSNLNYGDIITIRGYGKFKFGEFIGETKKGRKKVIIYKFI